MLSEYLILVWALKAKVWNELATIDVIKFIEIVVILLLQ